MKDNVLWLDIPVNDPMGVQFIDSLADMPHNPGNPMLGHRLMFFELLEELPACAHLQNDIHVDRIVKKPEHFDDIGVVEVGLDLEFPDELLGNFLLPQQLLLHNLQSTNKVGFFFLGQIHLAILP